MCVCVCVCVCVGGGTAYFRPSTSKHSAMYLFLSLSFFSVSSYDPSRFLFF